MKSLGRDPLWFALRRAQSSAPPRVIRFGLPLLVVSTVFFPALPTRAQEPVVTFTTAEADRGRAVHTEQCAQCHGSELSDGSAPALLGPTFRRTWSRPQVLKIYLSLGAAQITQLLSAQAIGEVPSSVKEIEAPDGEVTRVKTYNSLGALDKLARARGLYEKRLLKQRQFGLAELGVVILPTLDEEPDWDRIEDGDSRYLGLALQATGRRFAAY